MKQLHSPGFLCANSFQASGRHVAHYHCVVCSVTIARKTDMISHLKRHVNKGETEASYSGSSDVLLEEPGNKRRRHPRSTGWMWGVGTFRKVKVEVVDGVFIQGQCMSYSRRWSNLIWENTGLVGLSFICDLH